MNRYDLVLASLALVFIAGCATVDTQTQTARSKDDDSYLTGSRLPHGAASVRTIDKAGAEEMLRTRGQIGQGVPGK